MNKNNTIKDITSHGNAIVVNEGSYNNSNATTQNFWVSLSLIGTISIGTLIGGATLALFLVKNSPDTPDAIAPPPSLELPGETD